jgi:hypothetical protein
MNLRSNMGQRVACVGAILFLTVSLAACGSSDEPSPTVAPEPTPTPTPTPTNPVPADPTPVPSGLAKYVGTWEACSSAFLKTTYSITPKENGSLGLVAKGTYYTGPGCTGGTRAEFTQTPRVLSYVGQTTRIARTWNSAHYPEINITAEFDDFVSTGTVGWTLVGPEVFEFNQFGVYSCLPVPGGGRQCYLRPSSHVENINVAMHRTGTAMYFFFRPSELGASMSEGIPFQKVQ